MPLFICTIVCYGTNTAPGVIVTTDYYHSVIVTVPRVLVPPHHHRAAPGGCSNTNSRPSPSCEPTARAEREPVTPCRSPRPSTPLVRSSPLCPSLYAPRPAAHHPRRPIHRSSLSLTPAGSPPPAVSARLCGRRSLPSSAVWRPVGGAGGAGPRRCASTSPRQRATATRTPPASRYRRPAHSVTRPARLLPPLSGSLAALASAGCIWC